MSYQAPSIIKLEQDIVIIMLELNSASFVTLKTWRILIWSV